MITVAALAAAALAAGALGGASLAATPGGFDAGVYRPASDAPKLELAYHRRYCIARSPVAYGYGLSASLVTARALALANCAVRTPRGMRCFVTSCT
jgi:hypothetical protein